MYSDMARRINSDSEISKENASFWIICRSRSGIAAVTIFVAPTAFCPAGGRPPRPRPKSVDFICEDFIGMMIHFLSSISSFRAERIIKSIWLASKCLVIKLTSALRFCLLEVVTPIRLANSARCKVENNSASELR